MSSEFEERLIEAGNELLDPPASLEDLLTLLDKAEYYLARVEQSPCKSIEDALSPCTKALVADKLFKHSNTDVMVAVASCISEITRITAPEAPYSDEEMKEAFQLIVSSFEHLDDMCNRSYTKRALILETVAKVRSCVVMLDLECDALIVKMFKHFFKAIRDYHPENVFSSMETIMTLVIEESEDISTELLSPILDTLKKDNEDVLPIAKKLGESVLENCSTKLKDFLGQALISLGSRMDDYSEVVSIICQDGTSENKKTEATPAGQHEVDKEAAYPKSEAGNGVKQQAEDDSLVDTVSMKPEIVRQRPRLKITGLRSKDKTNNSGAEKEAEPARKSKKAGRKRGRKWSLVKKSTKRLGGTSTDSKKEPSHPVENGEDPSSNLPRSLPENQSTGADLPSDVGKKVDVAPSPKETGTESLGVSSLSKSEDPEKKEGSIKESEGPNNSGWKEYAGLEKRSEGGPTEDRTPIKVRISRKRSEATDNAKVNTMTPSPDKVNASTADKEGSSQKLVKFKDKKGTAKGKEVHQKDVAMSSEKDAEEGKVVSLSKKTKKRSRDEDQPIETPKAKGRKRQKDENQPLETPKDKGKRKRTPAKEVSDAKEYGEELVGSKVKVWWPKDRAFYEGVVDSFDALKKKHTVLYSDGDVENLNLRKERWEIIQDNAGPNEEQKVAESSRQSSPDMTLKVLLEMRSNKKLSSKKGKGVSSKKSEAVSPTSDHKPRAKSKNDANSETAGGGKADSNTPNIGSKLVGLARQMTSRSKGSSESKKDETKKEKSKKDPETAAQSRTPRSVGRPRKVKSGDSDKGKSGSSKRKLKDSKDPDIDSGVPPSKKSSLPKPKLKESKVDRDSGEDLSDKVKSSSLKMKAEENKEKSSSLKTKAEESKEKNSDSGEEPSDKVKSSLLKPKPNESKEVDMDSGEEVSEKVMSGSLKLKESEKVDEDYGEEPSEKLKSCSSKPKEKRKLEESDEVDEDSGEEPSDKVKFNSSKPEPEENEDMDQDSGNETEKENASEKETPAAESSPKPARGQKAGRKRRRGA